MNRLFFLFVLFFSLVLGFLPPLASDANAETRWEKIKQSLESDPAPQAPQQPQEYEEDFDKYLDVEVRESEVEVREPSEKGWDTSVKKKKVRKKRRKKSKRKTGRKKRRKRRRPPQESYVSHSSSHVSLLGTTPLVQSSDDNVAFSTFGLQVLLALPVGELEKEMPLHLELGLLVDVNRRTLLQQTVDFTVIYINLPVRLKTSFPLMRPRLMGELFVGVQPRIFSYNTREGVEGGLSFATPFTETFELDLGVGLRYSIGQTTSLRLTASYRHLSLGICF